MDTRLKHRLAGATIIVALVVIFLPMLLDGPVDERRISVPVEVPEEPEVAPVEDMPEEDFAQKRDPGREQESQPAPVVSSEASERAASEAVAEGGSGEEPSGGAAPSRPADPTGDGTPTAASDEAAPAVADGEAASGGDEDAASAMPGQWAVQVGSFRDEGNAIGLRDRLRENGFDVYVDRLKADEAALFRVRVGPVLERGDAETLAERLADQQELSVLVVSR